MSKFIGHYEAAMCICGPVPSGREAMPLDENAKLENRIRISFESVEEDRHRGLKTAHEFQVDQCGDSCTANEPICAHPRDKTRLHAYAPAICVYNYHTSPPVDTFWCFSFRVRTLSSQRFDSFSKQLPRRRFWSRSGIQAIRICSRG